MDFNPTFFSHPKAADGFTLASADEAIREFWIEHGIALPADRRGHRQGARLALRHQRLDSRRLQGPADRPPRPARAARPIARRDLRREARSAAQPRRGREQALRHRLGELRRRLARVLSGLRRHDTRSCSASTPATSIPTETITDKLSAVLTLARRDPAARQPRRPLGQRPRRDPDRRTARRSPRSWSAATTWTARTSASTTSTPASTASPPG